MSYVNSILKRNCAEELVGLFSNTNNPTKEMTESYGAFHHMKNAINKDDLRMDDFFNISIGDGNSARTSGIFTFLSKSANASIDPNMNMGRMNTWMKQWEVENLSYYKYTWEDYINAETDSGKSNFELDVEEYGKEHLGITLVHSHVKTMDVMRAFKDWKYVFVCPCCMKNHQILSTQQIEENNISVMIAGYDNRILSVQNQVIVYRNDRLFGGAR